MRAARRRAIGNALYGFAILAAIVAGLGVWGMAERSGKHAAQAEVQRLIAEVTRAQAEAGERQREIEALWAERVKEARDALERSNHEHERRLAAARRDHDAAVRGLRDAVFAAARAAGGPGAASGPAGDDAAAAVGDVLADLLRLAREHSAAAERHADEVRSLLDGWPRNEPVNP